MARRCSCPGVLPGELVRVRIVQRRRDFERAALLEVLTPSAQRVAAPCRLAGICGGCDWLHIGYAEQLAQKVALVRETLRRTGHIEWPEIDIEPSPPLASRGRAQVHRDEQGRLGYMGAGSNHVVPVDTCPIVVPAINGTVRRFSSRPPGHEQVHRVERREVRRPWKESMMRATLPRRCAAGPSLSRWAASSSPTWPCCRSWCPGRSRVFRGRRRLTCTAGWVSSGRSSGSASRASPAWNPAR